MATIGNAPVFPTESVLPGNLQVTSLTYNSVILNWSATTTTETSVRYDIRYRIVYYYS